MFGSIKYWLSVKIYFVKTRSLRRAKRMSQYRVSRSTIIAA